MGIDPGATGGIALLSGTAMIAIPTPSDDEDIINIIKNLNKQGNVPIDLCIMEQVGGYVGKKQPGSAMFNFGDSNGFIRGVIKTLRIPVELVTPQKWQKEFSMKKAPEDTKTEWKDRLVTKAKSLYPEIFISLNKGESRAIADALLLCEYGRRLRKF